MNAHIISIARDTNVPLLQQPRLPLTTEPILLECCLRARGAPLTDYMLGNHITATIAAAAVTTILTAALGL